MAIEYQGKKVTPKTFAKHKISDHLMKVFDDPEKYMGQQFDTFKMKQQDDIKNKESLEVNCEALDSENDKFCVILNRSSEIGAGVGNGS